VISELKWGFWVVFLCFGVLDWLGTGHSGILEGSGDGEWKRSISLRSMEFVGGTGTEKVGRNRWQRQKIS
jgi:hypothetical protein